MAKIRSLLLRWRLLAMAVMAAALLLKGLVPAGFMIHHETRTLTVAICADASGANFTKQIAIPLRKDDQAPSSAKEPPCAWSSLAMAATGPVDAALLAAALAFIVALGLLALALPAPSRPAYLRPPLRGPPAIA